MDCTYPGCPDHAPDEYYINFMEGGHSYEPDSNFEEQEREKCTAPNTDPN